MALQEYCSGEYITPNLIECVDIFCGIVLPAAALRGFRRRGGKMREIAFQKQQCLEIIDEANALSSLKDELKKEVERSYQEAVFFMGGEK